MIWGSINSRRRRRVAQHPDRDLSIPNIALDQRLPTYLSLERVKAYICIQRKSSTGAVLVLSRFMEPADVDR